MEEVIYKIIASIGILLIIFASYFSMKRKTRKKLTYPLFIFGGICLLIYSIHIEDIIFIILQSVFIITSFIEYNLTKEKNKNQITKHISIAYIIFITIFALDVKIFSIEFLIHLLPTIIFTSCLLIAEIKPKIGGIFFIIAGLGTIIVFNTYRELIPFIIISLIPLALGILYYIQKKK